MCHFYSEIDSLSVESEGRTMDSSNQEENSSTNIEDKQVEEGDVGNHSDSIPKVRLELCFIRWESYIYYF